MVGLCGTLRPMEVPKAGVTHQGRGEKVFPQQMNGRGKSAHAGLQD